MSPIDRAIADMPGILRKAARDARRHATRSFVEQYDPTFSRPRVLLGSWSGGEEVQQMSRVSRDVVLGALRRRIRHLRQLDALRYPAARGDLIAARRVYIAERYEAQRERASAKMARAA